MINRSLLTFKKDLPSSNSNISFLPLDSYPSHQTPYSADSTYWTGTGVYQTKSPVDTGVESFNVPRYQGDHFQSLPQPSNQHGVPSCLAGSQDSQRSVQTHEHSTVPMRSLIHPDPSHSTQSNKCKRRKITLGSDDEPVDEPGTKQPKLSSSYLINASTENETILQQFLSDWEKRDRLPTEKELRALATLTKIPFYKVAMWYGDRLRLTLKTVDHAAPRISPVTDSEVLQDIDNYIKEAKDKECSTSHSRKAVGGKYWCTWGCGYSTDSRDSWIRHEEKKQPQKFWHCIICQAMRKAGERRDPFIVHRRDKFLPHAKNSHPFEAAEELRTKSMVPYDAPFVRRCNFRLRTTGAMCNHHFLSWRERNEHYLQHFEETMPADSPSITSNRESTDDDDSGNDSDNDDEKAPTRKFIGTLDLAPLSSLSAPPVWGTRSQSDRSDRNYDHGCRVSNCSSRVQTLSATLDVENYDEGSETECRDPCLSAHRGDQTETAAHWLIHVDGYNIVKARPEFRYLALKYSAPQGATPGCLESSQGLPCPSLPPVDELPDVFKKVLSLAKDMDFEYLWIDIFCGLKKAMGGTHSVYKQANLILVIGHPSQQTDQIWHFTCDYRHLSMVQSWAKQSVSFHHLQQLGHGAYSIVDKVELRPTHETFARKIVFRTNTKQKLRGRHLQEIEIMQKLRHPHIARFVAAYYDRGAFNILMSPVADCDLRRFLGCPDQFPEKRQYIPKWFMSLAEALAYVHLKHCRHKDIKPANILISGSTVLLTDFGTSLDFSTTQSTSTGGALMTPKYCAPEVAASGSRGRSADVFSLGCVFAEMITVDLGKSLEDLHNWLKIDEESTDRHATYHGHLRELVLWLRMLSSMRLDDLQNRVLRISVGMLDEHPERRPTAVEITKALCPKKPCNGLGPNATCHCCPRLRMSPITHPGTALDVTAETLGTLIPQEQQLEMFILPRTASWNVSGTIGKTSARPFGFVFLSQFFSSEFSRTSQVQKGYLSKKQMMRFERAWKAWWRGVDAIPYIQV